LQSTLLAAPLHLAVADEKLICEVQPMLLQPSLRWVFRMRWLVKSPAHNIKVNMVFLLPPAERAAALTPLRVKFTSGDGQELLTVIQRNASELKQSLLQVRWHVPCARMAASPHPCERTAACRWMLQLYLAALLSTKQSTKLS